MRCIRERFSAVSGRGTSFEILKDDVRKQLAVHHLQNTRLTIGQISLMLGFPAQSALSRACRQWFELTSSDIRGGNQQICKHWIYTVADFVDAREDRLLANGIDV
ncbi:hypothetical protein PQR52_00200 [Paraburkholderia aspalathi]|uniref:helix-turn-helix domain-containing protein n=1 Tax=Paraburkholderia aspalathi TaxID=1324617 RepID=UPI0038B7CF0D